MKIYLSGPMSGIEDYNFPLFISETKRLRDLGYIIENPVENEVNGEDWQACMRADICQLMRCDAIAMLPGWFTSKGVNVEYALAVTLGFKVFNAHELT